MSKHISIVFIGDRQSKILAINKIRESKTGLFRVDLKKIVRRLKTLKAINPYYTEIEIPEGEALARIERDLEEARDEILDQAVLVDNAMIQRVEEATTSDITSIQIQHDDNLSLIHI